MIYKNWRLLFIEPLTNSSLQHKAQTFTKNPETVFAKHQEPASIQKYLRIQKYF
jgi:hypothetical protein